jgi:DNA-binding SARP family transcriptional activator/ABC-type oligopeptide transport system substrate-binding subunit/DNA-binding beta-propeller fold protein YncE
MEYRILGPLEVASGERVVPLGTGRQRALLALLLLHRNEAVSSDRLIDELWGGRPPATAAKVLQNLVSQLRRSLGDGAVVTRGHDYVLPLARGDLDVDRFEVLIGAGRKAMAVGEPAEAAGRFGEALALWRGAPLGDLADEPFARAEAARLRERRLVAFEERVEADLACGRHADLVGELELAVGREPLREGLRGQLMRALYRSGRQQEALRSYRQARQVMVGELGLEPGPTLQRLEQAILRQDPSLDAPPSRPAGGVPNQEPLRGRVARRPWAWAGLLGGAALLLVVAVAAIVQLTGGSTPRARLAAAAPNTVAVFDSGSERVVAQAPVGSDPAMLAYGAGRVWVANVADRTVSRIDPRTRKAVGAVVSLGARPGGLAFGAGALWVTDADGPTLLRVDARFGTVERIDLTPDRFASPGRGVAVGAGSVWVALGYPGRVERVDPRTRRVIAAVAVTGADALAFGEGALWVGGFDVSGQLKRINPRTNSTAPSTLRVTNPISALAVGEDAVWAAVALDGTVWKVNGRGLVVDTLRVGAGPSALAIGDGAVWVADARDGTVSRIQPTTGTVTRFAVGPSLAGAYAHGGFVWLAVDGNGAPRAAAGGAVRVGLPRDPVTDPAVSFDWNLQYATCAMLLNYPDRPGAAGARLQPEIATSMPRISAGGRTYTFRIRPGYRFSPPLGEPVTARTFKTTIERALSPRLGEDAPAFHYAGDIVGARAYRAGRARHLAGVTAHGDRLVIRLSRPAGDFPARIAMPLFCAVPTSTPVEPSGLKTPIPSAGPYYVVSHQNGRGLVLRRNPNYAGRRPQRLDEINIVVGVGTEEAVAGVQRGSLDYYRLDIPDLFLPAFQPGGRYSLAFGQDTAGAGRARPRYLLNPSAYVRALALNTSRPVFRDPEVRRAVSFAIDRRALAAVFGAEPTDQYLPRFTPGYYAADVYPLDAPDLDKARALMHGRRRRAVLWTCGGVVCRGVAEIVRRNLRPIGIDVVIRQYDDWFVRASERGARYDIFDLAFYVDYADPAAVLEPLLSGDSIGATGNTNAAYLHDRALDARLRSAARLTGAERLAAYGAIDVDVARDSAPMAAFANDNVGEFLSARVGCAVFQPVYAGVSLAALCVREQ